MGIKFRTDDGKTHEVNQQTGEMVEVTQSNGTSGTSGTAGGSNYGNNVEWANNEGWHGSSGNPEWYNADNYHRQIIWNMGTEIQHLKEENKMLKAQVTAIQKLLS